ncbi:hypothetical protein NQ318_011599 [Aromia moschata]|uniref:DDE-1 domain-containing protein n=1 Tax=Aromia moschata TaxID=1265417 RepID=A0AAV8Z8L8_9CUCU|nr:hypothetical protein NQ318_011599 [Aromia moschata]
MANNNNSHSFPHRSLRGPKGLLFGVIIGMPRKYIRKTQRQSWASQEDPVLLILDGHLSHTKNLDVILKARENFVTLLCLPPYTTHKLQPLDVGVMFPFNAYMDQALETWMNNHPGRTVTARKKVKAEARLIENKTVKALKIKNNIRKKEKHCESSSEDSEDTECVLCCENFKSSVSGEG